MQRKKNKTLRNEVNKNVRIKNEIKEKKMRNGFSLQEKVCEGSKVRQAQKQNWMDMLLITVAIKILFVVIL